MESKVTIFQFGQTVFRVLILKRPSENKFNIYIKRGKEDLIEGKHAIINSEKTNYQVNETISTVSLTQAGIATKDGGMQLSLIDLTF